MASILQHLLAIIHHQEAGQTVSLRESIADPAARLAGDTKLSGWLA